MTSEGQPGIKDPRYKTEIEEQRQGEKESRLRGRFGKLLRDAIRLRTNTNIANHPLRLALALPILFSEILPRSGSPRSHPLAIVAEGVHRTIDGCWLRLKDTLSKSSLVIVSGEAGVENGSWQRPLRRGKGQGPFFVAKAIEFNVSHVNQSQRLRGVYFLGIRS
jgi:hypothetical protein